MLPTPSTSHVNFDRIYEPAEDSFLLLDTLSSTSESAFLAHRFDQEVVKAAPAVLEVGTGSGVVLAFVTAHARQILGRTDVLSLGVDINAWACAATKETVSQASCGFSESVRSTHSTNGMFIGCLNADLSSCFRDGAVDILIFNPPYVPTAELPQPLGTEGCTLDAESTDFDKDSQLLSLSYAGGKDGMEVTDRLLDELHLVLNEERGVAYLLLCKQNKPELVRQRIARWGKTWLCEIVGQSGKTGGWEKLQILRICRTQTSRHGILVEKGPLRVQ